MTMAASQRLPKRGFLGPRQPTADVACNDAQVQPKAPPPENCAQNLAESPIRNKDRPFSGCQFGLPRQLFLGILSTSSGSARSISRRAIRSIKVAVVRPRRSASCAAVSTLWAKPSRFPGYAIPDPHLRCEMKNPTYVVELQKKLGAPSSETVESLRLLKAFLKLAPDQRSEIIELVERLATDPAPGPGDGDPALS